MLQDRHPWGGDASRTAQGMPTVSMMSTPGNDSRVAAMPRKRNPECVGLGGDRLVAPGKGRSSG